MTDAQIHKFADLLANANAAFAAAPTLQDGTFVMQGYEAEVKRLEAYVQSLIDLKEMESREEFIKDDPYYIAVCHECGGITAAWSANTEEIDEIVGGWKKSGRKVGYMTIAPRLSCTCPRHTKTTEETES